MKSKFLIFLILFFTFVYFIIKNFDNDNNELTKNFTSPRNRGTGKKLETINNDQKIILEEKNTDLKIVNIGNEKYRYAIYEIEKIENLVLKSNLEDKKIGIEFFEENKCKFLTNGGFYGEDSKPVGWLLTKEKLERNIIQSSLLDGFLYYDKKFGAKIGFKAMGEVIIWGLQNGPMLIFDYQKLSLKINNDEEDRRVFAGINQKGNLVFGIVVSEDNLTFGPMLTDMPHIVEKIGKENDMNFINAVNLDGGSASAFITDKIEIRETNLVGTWLCEK